MTYTKKQIIEFLKTQESIDNAINNINYIGNKDTKKMMMDGKVIFFIDKNITTRGQLKKRVIKYMEDNGWEKSGYEEVMTLNELLSHCEMEIE